MIRRQTWILLIIFAALIGLALYLQKNPLQNQASLTPSPTRQAAMVAGWSTSEITRIEFTDDQGGKISLDQAANGGWVLRPDSAPVDLGKVEELRTQILDTTSLSSLDSGISLDAIGLVKPVKTITLYGADNKKTTLKIGNLTPTQSGYYVIVDNQSPVVASRYAMDAIFESLTKERLLNYTPTPVATSPPEETPTP